MKSADHAKARAMLVELLDGWLENVDMECDRHPYIGPNISRAMADSVMAIWDAIEDTEKYLISENMLKTD